MPSQRKIVLITGAAGYIGSHIALAAIQSGEFSVVTIDNFANSFPTALKRVTKIAQDALPAGASEEDKKALEIEVIRGDISIKSEIDQIFVDYEKRGTPIWGVIHVAALKAVGESGEIPIKYYENNITATINLLDVMDRHGVYNIVYSSSATVYGAPSAVPIAEPSPLQPESVYGRTKFMSELIIKDVADSAPDKWRAIGLRYFNPAGSHPSGLIGEDPRGRPGNLLPLLAQMAVGKFPEGLKVFGNDYPTPDGTCVRDYIHIMDLAQGHVDALAALPRDEIYASVGSKGKYKAYNLGKGKGMSVLEMVAAMEKASGFKYKVEIVGRRNGDVPELVANPALAEKELGFVAKYNLEEMCRDQWNWQSNNPQGYEGQA